MGDLANELHFVQITGEQREREQRESREKTEREPRENRERTERGTEREQRKEQKGTEREQREQTEKGTEKETERRESKAPPQVPFSAFSYLLATSNNKNNSFSKPRAS